MYCHGYGQGHGYGHGYGYRSRRPAPKPNFTVEVRRAGRRCPTRFTVRSLVAALPSAPARFSYPDSGSVLARLEFVQWHDALEAVVWLWGRRLAGAEGWGVWVKSAVVAVSDQEELDARLRPMFVDFVEGVMDGEAVRECRKRAASLTEEIEAAGRTLGNRNQYRLFLEVAARKEGLSRERDLVERKLREFQAAMDCVLVYLDKDRQVKYCDDEFLPALICEERLDWNCLYHRVLREYRRLEEGLPIYGFRRDILNAIYLGQVMVVIGETGSGKSTQMVQYIQDSGLADDGSIVCCQPRKIAATSLARRVREESFGCYQDDIVVCYPSYSSAQSFNSNIVFTSDHCLLQHCIFDANLSGVSLVIIDEAHERSLNTDLLLALLKKLLLKRMDLRLIIMSATVDAAKFSDYFYGCNTFNVLGRSFPVEFEYLKEASDDVCTDSSRNASNAFASYVTDVIKVVGDVHKKEKDGAILAFLTSQSEVEMACESFQSPSFQSPSAEVLPLHGKLSAEEQHRVFQLYPAKRKIIFATNVAETSLTIPDVKFVVDSGMVKESKYDPGIGMNVLKICRTSQSSACQRAGRAGRTGPGKCYRLYSELDFNMMPSYLEPEIRRVHLGIAVLRILALGMPDVQNFDFIDAPDQKAIEIAIENLLQLGAVIFRNGKLTLTDTGSWLVKLGIEPRLGKLILTCCDYSLGKEGLVLAAVMANSSSIFCRVGGEDAKLKSDCLKVQFCHEYGDLFTLLSVYKIWEEMDTRFRNSWCWENSINAKSMRRCEETIMELERCLQQELQIVVPSFWRWNTNELTDCDKMLKKAILSSLTDNVAMHSGYDRLGYIVARTGQCVKLHPSCSLHIYNEKPDWVVFNEVLSVSNQYLVCVSTVDVESLREIRPLPSFDVSSLAAQKIHKRQISAVRNNLLRRFCGKLNCSLHSLISRIQLIFNDKRIGIDVDFEKEIIEVFASSKDLDKVYSLVFEELEYEKKWLREESLEKCLFRGGYGFPPSRALFGSGAEIKCLELKGRYFSVEVSLPNRNSIKDKELLMMFDKCAPEIAGYYKYAGNGQGEEDLEKWGKIIFHSPEAAEKVVNQMHGAKFENSWLKVVPAQPAIVSDGKAFPFPAIKARLSWPRRRSKGIAIIRCKEDDVDPISYSCSSLVIGGRVARCHIGRKSAGTIILSSLDVDTTEQDIMDALIDVTDKPILDIFIVRGEAVNPLPVSSYPDALLKEIAAFMPSQTRPDQYCRVQVFPPEPKDWTVRAVVTFAGSLYHQAAMALEHLNGKELSGCFPWQKIHCQQMFHSSVSCPAPIYHVIKKELDSLLDSFRCLKGVHCTLDQLDNGSYRVELSSSATKVVADLRKPLEQLMKGRTVIHPDFTPTVIQLLFSREGTDIMKTVGKETRTFVLLEKQNLCVKIFGSFENVQAAEQKLIRSLLRLHENKLVEIRLRNSNLGSNLLKAIIQKFGPNLERLKKMVPEADIKLDIRRHILSVQGRVGLKNEVEQIIKAVQPSTEVMKRTCDEPVCPVCLCEVEERYRLEACGHDFCRNCLIEQCESAIRTHDGFPLCCAFDGCKEKILYADLRSLLNLEKLDDLFKASLGDFVASSGGRYRFCPSPDCSGIYEAANSDSPLELPPYACGSCFVETCRRCHVEYHPSISCEKYQEFKDDPDTSLHQWRKGKEHVQSCPVCNYTIEKIDGCNHIQCKCGRHICWACLDNFCTSEECYEHLRLVHLAIV